MYDELKDKLERWLISKLEKQKIEVTDWEMGELYISFDIKVVVALANDAEINRILEAEK